MQPPFTYTNQKSIDVFHESSRQIKAPDLEKIAKLGFAYQHIASVIPQTLDNFGSGHFFPYVESMEEIQISYVLCRFGLYKQAMMSLRSAMELGLLSVYWNLNDDGHFVVRDWLHSQQDTPSLSDISSKLQKHKNFQFFQRLYDIKSRLLKLNFLHNYVHTKGHRFSNRIGLLTPNTQTFEEKGFKNWLIAFEEVTRVLLILHLVKYPIGVFRYDYDRKFGIDKPGFGGLDEHEIDRIEDILSNDVVFALRKLSEQDEHVKNVKSWLETLPDMTEEDVDQQILEFDMMRIEHEGLEHWLKDEQRKIHMLVENGYPPGEAYLQRIEYLKKWAKEQGYEKSITERSEGKS